MCQYTDLMLSIVREAGRIAVGLMDDSHPQLKSDASVITDADRAVSAMAHRKLAGLVATGRHVLIDEEDPRKADHFSAAVLDRTPYIWAIDPVDGTRAYANHMPHYGISLGLIRQRQPWQGAVYFPTLRELFYCDGRAAYHVRNAFCFNARCARIRPVDEQLSDRSVFILSDELGRDFSWSSKDCRYMVLSSAVVEFCWPAVGRGCGSLSRVYLWDMAGAWPIVAQAGLRFRNVTTGKPLERLELDLFRSDLPWKLKDFYILSSERNFPLLSERLMFP